MVIAVGLFFKVVVVGVLVFVVVVAIVDVVRVSIVNVWNLKILLCSCYCQCCCCGYQVWVDTRVAWLWRVKRDWIWVWVPNDGSCDGKIFLGRSILCLKIGKIDDGSDSQVFLPVNTQKKNGELCNWFNKLETSYYFFPPSIEKLSLLFALP